MTFIAVMDEKGFAPFAAVGNVANRARVTIDEARTALTILESPDTESSDPENEGRRLERVPGGWLVLNAEKHRDLVTRAIRQAQTAERVRRHRAMKRASNAPVTQSEAYSEAVTEEKADAVPVSIKTPEKEKIPVSTAGKPASLSPAAPPEQKLKNPNTDPFTDPAVTERAGRFVDRYGLLYAEKRNGARYAMRPARDYAAAVTLCQTWADDERLDKLAICFLTTDHKFAEEGSRTIPQFLALASWCDGKLAEWEKARTNGGRH